MRPEITGLDSTINLSGLMIKYKMRVTFEKIDETGLYMKFDMLFDMKNRLKTNTFKVVWRWNFHKDTPEHGLWVKGTINAKTSSELINGAIKHYFVAMISVTFGAGWHKEYGKAGNTEASNKGLYNCRLLMEAIRKMSLEPLKKMKSWEVPYSDGVIEETCHERDGRAVKGSYKELRALLKEKKLPKNRVKRKIAMAEDFDTDIPDDIFDFS
ncbi:hypothetical protein ThvES_00020970 [Thiovulum sp. ES]|nr:hypothetical protein ThvES_00020970 [Thiovulum sp. ES]